jgi:hypothetical protein
LVSRQEPRINTGRPPGVARTTKSLGKSDCSNVILGSILSVESMCRVATSVISRESDEDIGMENDCK